MFQSFRKRCLKWVSQNTGKVKVLTTGYSVLSSVRCGKNTVFMRKAMKTDALMAVRHSGRAVISIREKLWRNFSHQSRV